MPAVRDTAEQTRVIGDETGQTRVMPAREPMGPVYGPDEPGIHFLDEHTVMQPHGGDEAGARQMYDASIADTPTREVAIYRNTETGEYIVVQGDEGSAAVAPGEGPRRAGNAQRWKELLDSDVGNWVLERHSHPVEAATGAVAPVNRMASGAAGDMQVMVVESIENGGIARSSVIDLPGPNGMDQTSFGFDPSRERPFWIDSPDGAGGRDRMSFWNIEDFHAHMEMTFPGLRMQPIPTWLSGGHPVALAQHAASAARPTQTMSAAQPTERMSSAQPSDTVPISERTTQIQPAAERTTQVQPAGERPTELQPIGERPTLSQVGADRTTQVQPAGERPTDIQPLGERPTLRQGGGGGPGGGAPPVPGGGRVAPVDVLPIDSAIEANQVLFMQHAARGEIRVLGRGEARRVWASEYGQTGDPPPGWVEPSGKVVIDGDRVRTIEVESGPVPPPAGRETAASAERVAGPPNVRQALQTQAGPSRVEASVRDPQQAYELYWQRMDSFRDRAGGRPPEFTFEPDIHRVKWQLAGGEGDPPPAYIDQRGQMHVDASRVDVLFPPPEAGPTGAPSFAAPPASPASGGGQERSRSGPVDASRVTGAERTGAEASSQGPQPARRAQRAPGPWDMRPHYLEHQTNDPVEAARMYHEALATRGRAPDYAGVLLLDSASDPARVRDSWQAVNNFDPGAGDPPAAWRDSLGNVVVDLAKAPGALENAPAGPIRGESAHETSGQSREGLASAEEAPPARFPDAVPQVGEMRPVAETTNDPDAALRLFQEHQAADRFIRVINDRAFLEFAWSSEYQGNGAPPLAFTDSHGYLVVDAERLFPGLAQPGEGYRAPMPPGWWETPRGSGR
jgi:hypothetical protein